MSKRANGHDSGPVFTSQFLAVLNHSALGRPFASSLSPPSLLHCVYLILSLCIPVTSSLSLCRFFTNFLCFFTVYLSFFRCLLTFSLMLLRGLPNIIAFLQGFPYQCLHCFPFISPSFSSIYFCFCIIHCFLFWLSLSCVCVCSAKEYVKVVALIIHFQHYEMTAEIISVKSPIKHATD